ncbi:MAG: sugar ABC transporter ATP-binding protein [Anaerolineae bacterium]
MKVSLSARNVVKRYGGIVALADGNLEVQSGEVVALLGANGSGKSTLSKIITGVAAPNEGQLLLDGQPVTFTSPLAARKVGITAVYQELSLIPDMTVAENIWLAHEPLAFRVRIQRKAVKDRTRDLLNLFAGTTSPSLQPDTPVNTLPPDERQIVEILKALSRQPRLIILDEATASLDSQQVTRLFDLVVQWKNQGMAIVFVSHRMDEIFRIADRATVLRNGHSVGHVNINDTSERELVAMMIEGATTATRIDTQPVDHQAPVRLEIKALRTAKLKDINLTLRDGELLGLGGLQGQGQADLLLALFGATPFKGQMQLSGEQVRFTHPQEAMRKDVAFVPGDRGSEGLLLIRSIQENLLLPSWGKYGNPIKHTAATEDCQGVSRNLNIVMASLDAPVNSLSGGNAQKVVIGKWLLRSPKLLLLNDPTKGVDVGAKGEFYRLLAELRQSGTAILFYSSDDEELLGLCDRVLVMHDGMIHAELHGESLTRSNLVAASMGTT